MTAIYKREVSAYFSNMLGFVIVAGLMLFLNLFFVVFNVVNGYPYYAFSLSYVVTYLMVIVPLLTMRSFSEERKAKTDQLLMTAPVSVAEIVVGKFLAMMTVFCIPVLVSCTFPLLIAAKGNHNFAMDYSSILAFVLIAGAFIAIGMFLSSLTESSIIAAVLTFGVIFLLMIMQTITNNIPATPWINAVIFSAFGCLVAYLVYRSVRHVGIALITGLVLVAAVWITFFIQKNWYYSLTTEVLNALPFIDSFGFFAQGLIDLAALVKYCTIIVLFCFLTGQSLQKRRWN